MVIKKKTFFKKIVIIPLFFALVLGRNVFANEAVHSEVDDAWVDPVDTTEEDLVIPSLQASVAQDSKVDPKFVTFLADVGGRLTLPQTYKTALSDLLISLRNDQMWKSDVTLRRAMLSLLHKAEVYGRRNGGEDLVAVDQMVKEAFELWPPGPDRPRIIGLMNSVAAFQERQKMHEIASVEKAARDAEKEAAREKKEQDKLDKEARDQAAVLSKAPAVSKAKPIKVARPRVAKAKVAEKEPGEDALPDRSAPVRRSRAKKPVDGDVQDLQVTPVENVEYRSPERFDPQAAVAEEFRGVNLGAAQGAQRNSSGAVESSTKNEPSESLGEVAP